MGPVTLLLRALWAYWVVAGRQATAKKTLDTIFSAIVASTESYIAQQEKSAVLAAASPAPKKSSGEGGDVDVMEELTEETRLVVLGVLS